MSQRCKLVHSLITLRRSTSTRQATPNSSRLKLVSTMSPCLRPQVATYVHEYAFKTAPPRDTEAFGVEQFGRLVLIEKDRLGQAVQAMESATQ